jgi:hypothetical protein
MKASAPSEAWALFAVADDQGLEEEGAGRVGPL